MAYEVKIYGEIVSTYAKQQGAKGVSLVDVQAQLEAAQGQEIKVRLNSVGGDVQEGFAIYDELRRYAKENKVKVHTYAEAVLASIATVPFLAGDTRTVSRSISPFVHNAWMGIEGDSAQMKAAAVELEEANDKIARHYSDHTDLTYKEARELMNGNTSISSKEAVAMRFATNIEKVMRPAAMLRFTENNKPINTMNKKSKWAKIAAILLDSGIANKKVMDAEMREVDFYELLEDEPVEVGANATIDGKPAEGDVVMQSGETYVFAAGVLTEIRPKTEDGADDEALAAANQEIESLKEQLATANSTNATLATSNKTLLGTINKISALQAEFEEDETKPAPTAARKPAPADRPQTAAVASYVAKTKNLTQK